VHYAAELTKNMAHDDMEDTDMTKLLLEYNGDTNMHTRLVSQNILNHSCRLF
jgi:hypothetical protein